jgi:hypothetical protein
MKTNNAFDPNNFSEIRSFVVIPEYLRNRYSKHTEEVYGEFAEPLQVALRQFTHCMSGDRRASEWLYVFSTERDLGFWILARQDTVEVRRMRNGYSNPAMDSATYGLALTLHTLKSLSIHLASGAEADMTLKMASSLMASLYIDLRLWGRELGADGEAVESFLDGSLDGVI